MYAGQIIGQIMPQDYHNIIVQASLAKISCKLKGSVKLLRSVSFWDPIQP